MNLSKVIKPQNGQKTSGSGTLTSGGDIDLTETDFLSFDSLWQMAEDQHGPAESVSGDYALAFKDADAIIQRAKGEAHRIEQEAYQKGFEKGEADGVAAGEKQVNIIIQNFSVLLEEVRSHKEDLSRQYEEELFNLLMVMVDKLVGHEISVNPRMIKSCLQNAMEFVIEKSAVKVRLSVDDFERIKEAGLTEPALLEGKSKIHLIEDPSVSTGGCILETDFGEIDATIENRRKILFEAVEHAFFASLSKDYSEDE